MREWQQPEARMQTQEPIHTPVHISTSEAQVESKSHTVHVVPKVRVQPKDGVRTRANGSSKKSLLPSRVIALTPLLLPAFSMLVKDESRMASPQSQVTKQGFQGQKPPLQNRTVRLLHGLSGKGPTRFS